MTEIVLTIVIITLCFLLGFMDYNNRKERKSLINAIKAKEPIDFINAELADKTNIKIGKEKEPNIVPPESVSDEEFLKVIDKQVNG